MLSSSDGRARICTKASHRITTACFSSPRWTRPFISCTSISSLPVPSEELSERLSQYLRHPSHIRHSFLGLVIVPGLQQRMPMLRCVSDSIIVPRISFGMTVTEGLLGIILTHIDITLLLEMASCTAVSSLVQAPPCTAYKADNPAWAGTVRAREVMNCMSDRILGRRLSILLGLPTQPAIVRWRSSSTGSGLRLL